jgi:hypothetical protein
MALSKANSAIGEYARDPDSAAWHRQDEQLQMKIFIWYLVSEKT